MADLTQASESRLQLLQLFSLYNETTDQTGNLATDLARKILVDGQLRYRVNENGTAQVWSVDWKGEHADSTAIDASPFERPVGFPPIACMQDEK